jgi:hypothetical protein
MTNLQAITAILAAHREARRWTDDAVAADLVAQLGLDPAADAKNAAPVIQPGITEAEVVAHEHAAMDAVDKAMGARAALTIQAEVAAKADADAKDKADVTAKIEAESKAKADAQAKAKADVAADQAKLAADEAKAAAAERQAALETPATAPIGPSEIGSSEKGPSAAPFASPEPPPFVPPVPSAPFASTPEPRPLLPAEPVPPHA